MSLVNWLLMGMLADERSTNHFEEVLTLNKGQFDASVLVKSFLKKEWVFHKKVLKTAHLQSLLYFEKDRRLLLTKTLLIIPRVYWIVWQPVFTVSSLIVEFEFKLHVAMVTWMTSGGMLRLVEGKACPWFWAIIICF